ncbi:hypothetical protein FRC09_015045 [Ceratobasidium sp. 395]|nr:hypothetical protein FRC09_015045 [Ceratobasidium sp. 395]
MATSDHKPFVVLKNVGQSFPQQAIYIIISPDPVRALQSGQILNNHPYSFQLKIGDGRDGHVQQVYSTYNPNAGAIQLIVPSDMRTDLDLYDLEYHAGRKQGKQLQRAFFEGVANQQQGLVRSEWFTLTAKDAANNQGIVLELSNFLKQYGATSELWPTQVAIDNPGANLHNVSNLLEDLSAIINFCYFEHSPGTIVYNQ